MDYEVNERINFIRTQRKIFSATHQNEFHRLFSEETKQVKESFWKMEVTQRIFEEHQRNFNENQRNLESLQFARQSCERLCEFSKITDKRLNSIERNSSRQVKHLEVTVAQPAQRIEDKVIQKVADMENTVEFSSSSEITSSILTFSTDSYTYLPNIATSTGTISSISPCINNYTNYNLADNMDIMNYYHDELESFTYEEEDFNSNCGNEEFPSVEDCQFADSIFTDSCHGIFIPSTLPCSFDYSPRSILSGCDGLDTPHGSLEFIQLVFSLQLYYKVTLLLLLYYYNITDRLSVYISHHRQILIWDPGI